MAITINGGTGVLTGLASGTGGKILQIVDNHVTNTASQTATANGVKLDISGMSATITPTSTSNFISISTHLVIIYIFIYSIWYIVYPHLNPLLLL